ncbi:MAG: 1-deoxy-D-xylulose-5-phosphate reductoisomerase [Bacilli bacterium]|nr:1-deoxy-D-xylulose-5-phosphate reductoisomerase [Bacilli bacterium]
MKDIILLGATGSIGSQTLDIIDKNPHLYTLKAFSFGHNINKALEIIEKFKPLMVCTPFDDCYEEIKRLTNILVTKSLEEVSSFETGNPYVVNAIVGIDGLIPTITAIKKNRVLLLANKESLVMAGELVNQLLDEHNSVIVPIDSEHSALYQLLHKEYHSTVKKLIITASGGALRDYPIEKLNNVKAQDALKHPNWQMGAKITIDSATMINKVFELIEAHYLFRFSIDSIKAVMDRRSIVHALVEMENGMVAYHQAQNDMHLPIEYALQYPDSIDFNLANELVEANQVMERCHLEELDINRFKVLKLAKHVIETKGFSGVILTTINDIFVDKFLKDECGFLDIENNIFKYLNIYEDKFKDLEYNIENIIKVKELIIKEVNKK